MPPSLAGSGWQTMRSIVLDNAAREASDRFEDEFARFDEAWKALEWLLSRNPDQGVSKIVGSNRYFLYKQDSDVYALTPVITVLYTFDENSVFIHSIRASEADRSRQGSA